MAVFICIRSEPRVAIFSAVRWFRLRFVAVNDCSAAGRRVAGGNAFNCEIVSLRARRQFHHPLESGGDGRESRSVNEAVVLRRSASRSACALACVLSVSVERAIP